jgi:hypothetical protein
MWWLLSVLTFCGMPSLLADVCSGLPASPPNDSDMWRPYEAPSFQLSVKARRISVPHYGSSIMEARWGGAGRRRYARRRY